MTIYAIVNGLIHPGASVPEADPVWTILSPSSILQGGNPYFVPDFASHFEARTALALRIGKLGKGVAHRFVYRYVEAVAPAVVFIAADLLSNLREQGLPWTKALSYDRALAVGKFQQAAFDRIADCECSLMLQSDNAGSEEIFHRAPICPSIEETIRAVSRDNTLKTGDIIIVGLTEEGPEVRPGLRAVLSLDGEESLKFNIR